LIKKQELEEKNQKNIQERERLAREKKWEEEAAKANDQNIKE
jgi:hypothetical protein